MKLKVVFITFNSILFVLLFTVFFLPLFYADGSFMREFWKLNWFFGPIFLLLIIVVNILFFKNRRLISYIEAEDWVALSEYIEDQIFNKNKINFKNTHLLTEALLLLGDFPSMNRLEALLKERKSKYIIKLAPKFAASKMISGDYADLLTFTLLFNTNKHNKNEWMGFYTGLAQQMMKNYESSAQQFENMSEHAQNMLVKVLSAYFVLQILHKYSTLTADDIKAKEAALHNEVNRVYTFETWKKYTESEKQELHVMVLTKIIDEAGKWLFR